MKCECGCNSEAVWLLTFYDPTIPSSEKYMPACNNYKKYIASCCADLDLPFEKKLIKSFDDWPKSAKMKGGGL